MPSFRQLEDHSGTLILKGMMLVIFWVAVWGLLQEQIDMIKERYGFSYTQIYLVLLTIVVGIFLLFPSLLMKL